MSERSPSSNKRKLSNFFIAPDRQLKISFFAVGIGLLFFLTFFGFQIWMFSELILRLTPLIPETFNLSEMIASSIHRSWMIFIAGGALFTFIVVSVSIIISHRIYGPIYAIRKHLAAIGRGEFEYRTRLRKWDEFKDVAEELNHLSESLASKTPPSNPV